MLFLPGSARKHVFASPSLRCLQDETLMLNVFNPRRDVLRLRVWDADTFTEDLGKLGPTIEQQCR